MTMNSKKKIGLIIHELWYWIAYMFIVPTLFSYLFRSQSLAAEILSQIIILGLPALLLIKHKCKRCEKDTYLYRIDDFPLKNIPLVGIICSIVASISLFFFITYTVNVVHLIYYFCTNEMYTISMPENFNLTGFLLGIISNAFLPALLEETLCRGLYFDAFRQNNKYIAILVPAIVFASLHSGIIPIVNAFLMGMFLMIIYMTLGSLKLVIILHMMYNVFGIVFNKYLILPFTTLYLFENHSNSDQIMIAFAISVAVSLLSIIIVSISLLLCVKINIHCSEKSHSKNGLIDKLLILIMLVLSLITIIIRVMSVL